MWKARSTAEKSAEYVQHATSKVPTLEQSQDIAEHTCSATRLTAQSNLLRMTLWESMEAVRKFAEEPEKAVVNRKRERP